MSSTNNDNSNKETTLTGVSPEEFRKTLENLEKSNAGQEKYAKLQFFMTMISAIASVAALCIVIFMVNSIMPQVNLLITDIQATMTNVEKITTDLAAVDMEGMAGNIDSLVGTSERSITEAMDKLQSIDFEGLNRAISDLGNIVAPLASLFGGRR